MIRRAKDGLPARVSGPWTQEKLAYVERYAQAFMKAMAPKRAPRQWSELVYLDPLAGPGRGIDRHSNAEFDGSPLRALRVVPPFDRLFFSDLSGRNVEALRNRIPSQDRERVVLRKGDCHEIVRDVVMQLSPRALGLAFVDPQGFEATFRLFETLTQRRFDLLLLFPSGIGIARNLSGFARRERSPMDELWGGREWRERPIAKLARGKRLSFEESLTLDRSWVRGFRIKMERIGFQCQDEADPYFVNEKRRLMYHLLFFSRDPAGVTIWRGVKKIEPSGQRPLPF